jgi:hypothetical protein
MRGGIALNEDDSHYFFTRAGQALDREAVAGWVDQYAETQVKELILNPNCMRTSYASNAWNPIWHGYDPRGKDDQPLLASLASPEERKNVRKWIHTAWQLHHDGIDPYQVWIERCRQKQISPWISMRMNDIHHVDDEKAFIHSEFWRENPQLRRITYPRPAWDWVSKSFDYAQAEVREHHLKLLRELVARYDVDGLELDWMRSAFHFRPGYESEGAALLTDFTRTVRRLLDAGEQERGHRIKLSARVASRPQTALALGMDATTWARQKLIDMLVVTPFFGSIETDMPMELWQRLLEGTSVTLAAGLEILLRPYGAFKTVANSLETVRGAAISLLERGADRIYLFNYMDSTVPGSITDSVNYPRLLRDIGSLDTCAGKPRRHVITYADTWAPGEPCAMALPATLPAPPPRTHEWKEFRIHIGPRPSSGNVVAALGLLEGAPLEAGTLEVRLNGERCELSGPLELPAPAPDFPVYGFAVPLTAVKQGYNLLAVLAQKKLTIGWVELRMTL